METTQKKFDVFISHATEDKDDFVRPLVEALSNLGYRIWYDEFTISVGDGLRRAIDKGISNSRFGIVILSKDFFSKGWTNYELDGLIQFDIANKDEGIILPIWYNISRKDVVTYSPSLANKYAISSDGKDINKVVGELEKKIGDYLYTVDNQGKIMRSERKVNIDISTRDKKIQLITNHVSHRLVSKEKCVITAESIIYPYSKDFNTLKYGHWQSNKGIFQLVRHVAYDWEHDELLSSKTKILENTGNNFFSAVEFVRISNGPIKVICEIKATNLYKSVFEEGSDETEVYHPLKIEHSSFSLYLPNRKDFANLKVFVNGEQKHYVLVPGGRLMKHEIFGTGSSKTIYFFVNEVTS